MEHRSTAISVVFVLTFASHSLAQPQPQPQPLPRVTTTSTALAAPRTSVRELCNEHVMGNVGEIHWQLYASTESPSQLVSRYITQFGRPDRSGDGQHLEVRGPDNLVVSIYPVGERNRFPHCNQAPNGNETTLILVSVFYPFQPRPSR